ncbi:shikimate dehydrogenase [Quadrisphaera granulorum]|uniref:Shikimate dehydrogenase n=1 Tax=Quadrisphaera granulorum TaxID=317664 RepID=A0A315ZRR6_9ACTN|nr:shikimate dehydrogenase [Quadrisphaera granulorum]PWJ47989.1 shikimate dehydrogenase [Quadrisphaera granulorum]SZE98561.1 shikimate dehydrogenase [Quadrisphaera granulorum]
MKAAVWGSPIAHSLSPALHRAAYSALGLDWTYDRREVDTAALPAAFAELDAGWAGVSLTMPLKQAVIPLLASASDLALAVGSVNTLVPVEKPVSGSMPDSPVAWRGVNTDVHGIIAALAEVGLDRATTAVVLGGGATAASAVAALAKLGVTEPVVVVRSVERAWPLLEVGERLGVRVALRPWGDPLEVARVLAGCDAAVSTAPAGAADAVAGALSRALGGRPPAGALLDVVYAPWPTALAQAWAATGGDAVGGFSMLVHQAERQVQLMTGRSAPLEVMRAAGEAAMAVVDARTDQLVTR